MRHKQNPTNVENHQQNLVGNQKIGVASLPDVQDNLKVSQMWAEIPSQDALSPKV
jgi:hypothetical protein|tara:strand:- start:80 stop:244 length:165 start_codon:yes stop_codon:yes gene_type:complete